MFLLRAMWYELHGGTISRYDLSDNLCQYTKGGLVMDSKGVPDAMTRNASALHGLRSSGSTSGDAGHQTSLGQRHSPTC